MRSLSMKRTILATAAALALGVAALGVVGAQQGQPDRKPGRSQAGQWEQRYQQYVEAVAKRVDVDPDRLKQAMAEARQEVGWSKPGGHGRLGGLRVAAQLLNMDAGDLRRELANRSMAEVAKSRGVDPNTIADAWWKAAEERIDRAVAAGWLSAERAREMKQRLGSRIDERMNKTWPARGEQQGRRGDPGR